MFSGDPGGRTHEPAFDRSPESWPGTAIDRGEDAEVYRCGLGLQLGEADSVWRGLVSQEGSLATPARTAGKKPSGASEVAEQREMRKEGQGDGSSWSIAVLGHDEIGLSLDGGIVGVLAVDEHDDV